MSQIVEPPKPATAVHGNLYQALAAAQAQMGPAIKDAVNPAFKSRYADLASVMAACIPALSANGIAVLQPPCEIDGARYVKTILAHSSGETVECAVPLIIGKNDMQGYGSAVTYARRYGLMAMAGIAPDDDDGNAAVMAAPKADAKKADPKPQPRDPRQVANSLIDVIRKTNNAADLADQNTEGRKFADAWQWLEDEHSALAAEVKAAFDARMNALRPVDQTEIPY